ncbi:MAG: YigZ family protein [Flavobacteriales bacterium]|nr:YigZ family protein [Flavobacteriales bacterium]
MTEGDQYRVLLREGGGVYREKASKFLAFAYPWQDEETALEQIQALRKLHPKARHVCYAFRYLNTGRQEEKSNDDHEPGGTAGLPILNKLRSADIQEGMVAVVRYFGGTLLGKTGLIKAYGEAAALAISEAGDLLKFHTCEFCLQFPYTLADLVQARLEKMKIEIVTREFELDCTFVCAVRNGLSDAFQQWLKEHRISYQIKNK